MLSNKRKKVFFIIQTCLVFLFVFSLGLSLASLIIDINLKREEFSPYAQHYNIVFANTTVPLSMASMAVWTSPDETYMWYGRRDTFAEISRLRQRVHLVGGAGTVNTNYFSFEELSVLKKKVRQIYDTNHDNTFTLYHSDEIWRAPLQIFYENNIPESNFNIKICSDGDGSYANLRDLFSGKTTEAGQQAVLDNLNEEWDNLVSECKSGEKRWKGREDGLGYGLCHTLATRPNVELWLQRIPDATLDKNGNGFYDTEEDARFAGIHKDVAAQINFVRKDLKEMSVAMEAVGGTYAMQTYRRMMFGNGLESMFMGMGGKKPLIVTGTAFTVEETIEFAKDNGESSSFEVAMNKIKEVYGEEYFFIYKGHPVWPTHQGYADSLGWNYTEGVTETDFNNRVEYLSNTFDSVIPAQMPADMIMVFYPEFDLNFGGYDSSLFVAADKVANPDSDHNVLFFIGEISENNQAIYNSGGFEYDGKNPGFLTPDTINTFTGGIAVNE